MSLSTKIKIVLKNHKSMNFTKFLANEVLDFPFYRTRRIQLTSYITHHSLNQKPVVSNMKIESDVQLLKG